ncbi:hypothetical protein DFQ30_007838 [Apophysomyces sp. BC1015]|nr:hypothetical protein DFQ30_007838 [Apophysomyces sp. BC1015]
MNDLTHVTEKLKETEDKLRRKTNESETSQIDQQTIDALKTQLAHSQEQVCVLKATMEQFLRIGIFNDQLIYDTARRYPTTSKASAIEAVVAELESRNAVNSPGVEKPACTDFNADIL